MRSSVWLCAGLVLAFTAATFIVTGTAAAGVRIHVPIDQPTIAAGLGVATSGDTVVVACDTYYESGLSLPSGVVLMAADYDSGCVVIDGGPTRAPILTCNSITGAAVQGITFTNGSSDNGGAVMCASASVVFDYCFFTGNSASVSGGGMYWAGGTPEIYGCTFNGNSAVTAGGGLALYGTGGSIAGCRFASNGAPDGAGAYASMLGTTTIFTECEFQWNVATNPSGGGGGAYLGPQAGPTFMQCRFDQNDGYYGGAAYNGVKTEPAYVNCEFEDNSSIEAGGAVYGDDDYASFDGCEFIFNVCSSGGGGGIHFSSSDATVENSSFYMNDAVEGGAIVTRDGATVDVTSCTIAENIVPTRGSGAGIFAWDSSTVTVDQTIIAFNRGGSGVACASGGAVTLTCSDVSDNEGGDWVDCIAGQESSGGNLCVNPFFCALAWYDLYLCADSQCLPAFNDCMELIGAWPEGCGACSTPVETLSWGAIKAMYR